MREWRRQLEEIAHPFDILEHAGMGDEKNLVKAQMLDPLQPLAGFVRGADQRDMGHLRQPGGSGLLARSTATLASTALLPPAS